MSKVYTFFADGMEEIEGLTVVDLLRRVGIEIDMVSITGKQIVTGSHGIGIETDVLFEDADFSDGDMLVLPGGMPGTTHLGEHDGLCELLKAYYAQGKYVAAICAAPSVLGKLGILDGRKATCYPTFEDKIGGGTATGYPSVIDENVITGRGMGTAIDFAADIITVLKDRETADEVLKAIVYQ